MLVHCLVTPNPPSHDLCLSIRVCSLQIRETVTAAAKLQFGGKKKPFSGDVYPEEVTEKALRRHKMYVVVGKRCV